MNTISGSRSRLGQGIVYFRSRILWKELINAWLAWNSALTEYRIPDFSSVDTLLHVSDDGSLIINFFFLDHDFKSNVMMIVEAKSFDVASARLDEMKYMIRVIDQKMVWVDDIPAEVVYGAARLILYFYGERIV